MKSISSLRLPPTLLRSLAPSAIISSILLLPFLTLELKNREGYGEGFPGVLFVVMWLLPFLFIVLLGSVIRNLRAERRGNTQLLGGFAVLIMIAWFWIGLVVDQTPCFLGVRNCD